MLYVTEGTNTYKRRQADTKLFKQALGYQQEKKPRIKHIYEGLNSWPLP